MRMIFVCSSFIAAENQHSAAPLIFFAVFGFLFTAVPYFVRRVRFLFGVHHFCLQRSSFDCSISFLFAACRVWAIAASQIFRFHRNTRDTRAAHSSMQLTRYHAWKIVFLHFHWVLKWTIICRARPYSNITKRCDLCTTEKLMIINSKPDELLNKRSELISKCRHENIFINRLLLKTHALNSSLTPIVIMQITRAFHTLVYKLSDRNFLY